MDEKILINENKNQVVEFQRSIDDVIDRANELINAWHAFSDWHVISTYNDFLELVKDPVAMLDKLLTNSVDIKVIGKSKLNPEVIAEMLSIDRESWLNLVAGHPISSDCIPCKKTKIRKGTEAISLNEFQQYRQYVTFVAGQFIADVKAIKEKQESMKIYTNSDKQIELLKFWENACTMLNELHSKGYFNSEVSFIDLQNQLQKRLMYSYATNRLHVNTDLLMSDLLKIK